MRIARSALLVLALWSAGGFFAFLLLPVLCDMPLWVGVVAGWLALVLQLLWGHDLVRCLLRWQKVAEENQTSEIGLERQAPQGAGGNQTSESGLERQAPQGAATLIDADCPMVLLLPEPTFTRGAAQLKLTQEMVDEWRPLAPSPAEAAYLARLLALPCLLRAFEAVTNSYGKLRFSEGPLWYLGRFFAFLAKVAEAPLRWCWGEKRPSCELQKVLTQQIAEQDKLPAWIRALDLLSPVSLAEVARERRWQLLKGGASATGEAVPAVTVSDLWIPVTGLLVGVLLAVSPWHWWGALPLCMGIGCGLYFKLRWPEWQGTPLGVSVAAPGRRNVAVHWQGKLEASPEGMAFPRSGWCLRTADGLVALRRLPGKRQWQNWVDTGAQLEVWGWFDRQRIVVQVEAVCVGSCRFRDRFALKYAPWPWLLALSGGAWLALQYIGL